jgi:predicted ester cyclase
VEIVNTEDNKSVVRNMLQLIEKGDVQNAEKFFSPNWVNHDPSLPPMQGFEGARQLISLWHSFSDKKITIEDSIAEGDRVAIRFKLSGTQTGTFLGIAPTGKTIHISATGIFRIVDGKASDNWVNIDALGLLQQLGAVPVPQR